MAPLRGSSRCRNSMSCNEIDAAEYSKASTVPTRFLPKLLSIREGMRGGWGMGAIESGYKYYLTTSPTIMENQR